MIYFSDDNIVLRLMDDKSKEYQTIVISLETLDRYKAAEKSAQVEIESALFTAFQKVLKQRSRR